MTGTKRKISEGHSEQFVCNANDVISFKFVLSEADLKDEENCFKPEFTHQFFGDCENIFGYIGLHINFFYSACRLIPYIGIEYREKVKSSKTGGVEPDDVYKIICDKLEFVPATDIESFTNSLDRELTFTPFGECISCFRLEDEEYKVYRADTNIPGFKKYHRKMQTLILWFIDGASYIDEDDERWDYFILYQHVKGDKEYYRFVGYATVYRYYAYPKMIRPRISQMLVIPPFQKRGLGSKMLDAICNTYIKDPDVLDITVEDPSDEFISIRDYVDSKNCLTLPTFSEENLKKGFSKEMFEEAREKFKINKKQARRVYEILRLKYTDVNNKSEYKAYRLDVKNRLNAPFQKEKLDLEKLQKTLTPEEINAAKSLMPREQRIEQLEHMYKEMEAKYQSIIERLLDE